MKTTSPEQKARVRKEYTNAVASLWQQETPEDFFTALYLVMTIPRIALYRSSKIEGKSGWRIQRDTITPRFGLNFEELKMLPAVNHFIELNVPKSGCHIVTFSDAAIVLYYDHEEKIVAMLASANSF